MDDCRVGVSLVGAMLDNGRTKIEEAVGDRKLGSGVEDADMVGSPMISICSEIKSSGLKLSLRSDRGGELKFATSGGADWNIRGCE